MVFAEAALAPEPSRSYDFDRSWQATPSNANRARTALLAHLASAADGLTLDAIGGAVTEAATNSAYHAFVGRRVGHFRITAEILPEELAITVEDDGCGFDPAAVKAGAGLQLITAFARQVVTTARPHGGTRTAMVFARATSPAIA